MPIQGTTKLHRLMENNEAAYIELMPKELPEIEAAASQIKVVGNRYTEQMGCMTGR